MTNQTAYQGEAASTKQLFLEPSVLTILASYRCTAECEHCCFDSNPRVTERITLQDIVGFIERASQLGSTKLVVFSGGECFLLGTDLTKAIARCTSLGLRSRCVTNGYWAKSVSEGRRRLLELKAAGLNELNISTGDFHQEFVSEQAVVNAACLGVELGFDQTLVVVEVQKKRRVTRATLAAQRQIQGLLSLDEARFKIIESPWMPMSLDEVVPQTSDYLLNSSNVHLRNGCASIFSTIVLTPSRKVGFCCGLTRERIPELNAVLNNDPLEDILKEGGREFMKVWLAVEGPERILAWAAGKDPKIEWENRYAHHCHACLALFADERVRNTIRTHYRERIDDVLMRYCMLLRAQHAN